MDNKWSTLHLLYIYIAIKFHNDKSIGSLPKPTIMLEGKFIVTTKGSTRIETTKILRQSI